MDRFVRSGNRNNSDGSWNNQGSNGNYWSSSPSSSNARNANFNASGGNIANNNNRANGFSVRCLKNEIMDETCRELTLSLFTAYYDCRKNKRNTANATDFEVDFEARLFRLRDEIASRTYEVGRSIAFVVDKPVKREIFAGDFRDRVVHHYLVNEMEDALERLFIHDSYACRKGKWTLFWIRRIEKHLRSATSNFTREAYVLKLDVSGFFMSINRGRLLGMLESVIERKYQGKDPDTLRYLLWKVLGNDPTENCTVRGTREDWVGLPKNKSLFFAPKGIGLPIGNLTSQIFANLYMHPFDEYVKRGLRVRHYGRYVDDFVLIHSNREFLVSCVSKIRTFLMVELGLTLHPDKIVLRNVRDGFSFLWGHIKPYRTYVGNRAKGNFAERVNYWNRISEEFWFVPTELRPKFLASVNSYLWLFQHLSAYRLKKNFLEKKISTSSLLGFRKDAEFRKIMLKK